MHHKPRKHQIMAQMNGQSFVICRDEPTHYVCTTIEDKHVTAASLMTAEGQEIGQVTTPLGPIEKAIRKGTKSKLHHTGNILPVRAWSEAIPQ